MYDQTSAGRDREMDVGGTSYDSTSRSATATDSTGATSTGTEYTGTEYAGSEYAGSEYAGSDYTETGTDYPHAGTGAGDEPGVTDKAATAAKTGAHATAEGARDVAQTARQEARNVADEVSTQARRVAGDMREQLRDRAAEQHGTMVSKLRQTSDELHQMAMDRDQSPATTLVDNLAERTNRFADHLESRGPEGVLNDVQEFARRRPGTFLLAAAAAGFVVGRLGKSVFTAPNGPRSEDSGQEYRSAYQAGAADTRAGYPTGTAEAGAVAATAATASVPTAAGTGSGEPIRDDGDWADPRPEAVMTPGDATTQPLPMEGGRS